MAVVPFQAGSRSYELSFVGKTLRLAVVPIVRIWHAVSTWGWEQSGGACACRTKDLGAFQQGPRYAGVGACGCQEACAQEPRL